MFLFFSTTGVNGFVNDKLRPIKEDTYGGLDPSNISNSYLISKTMGENLCYAWAAQKKVPEINRGARAHNLNDRHSPLDRLGESNRTRVANKGLAYKS